MARVIEGHLVDPGGRFALVAARFNELIVTKLVGGALDALRRHGIDVDERADLAWVPGCYEIPLVCSARGVRPVRGGHRARRGDPWLHPPLRLWWPARSPRAWRPCRSPRACRASSACSPPTPSSRRSSARAPRPGNAGFQRRLSALEMASCSRSWPDMTQASTGVDRRQARSLRAARRCTRPTPRGAGHARPQSPLWAVADRRRGHRRERAPEATRSSSPSGWWSGVSSTAEIDALIEQCSTNWRLRRMPVVDRNILRSAAFELMHCAGHPGDGLGQRGGRAGEAVRHRRQPGVRQRHRRSDGAPAFGPVGFLVTAAQVPYRLHRLWRARA
jgi:hypothetical protein